MVSKEAVASLTRYVIRQETDMIARVNWVAWKKNPSSGDGPVDMYHVYQCDNYMVETLGYSGSSGGDSGPSKINLFLNHGFATGSHELVLSSGDMAYIMNDEGKTIDVIRTV